MASGRCYKCHKYCTIVVTVLVGIMGLCLISSGLWVRVDPEFRRYVDESDNFNFLYAGAYVIICVGVVIKVVAILGCFGATKDNVCIIVTYFIALLILFSFYTTVVAAAFLAIIQKQTLLQLLAEALYDLVGRYYTEKSANQLISSIQGYFRCCGAEKGISDYVTATGRKSIPGVCPLELFGKPCNTELVNAVENNIGAIAAVTASIAFVLLLGLVESILLCRSVRDMNLQHSEHNGGSSVANSRQMTPSLMTSSLNDEVRVIKHRQYHHPQQQQQQQNPYQCNSHNARSTER